MRDGNLDSVRPGEGRQAGGPARQKRFAAHIARVRSAFSLRGLAIFFLAAAIVPAILTVLYSIQSVRPASTLMVGRWLTFQPVQRQWTAIDDVSPSLIRAVMMSEDGQFCAHHGVDLKELNNVIDEALEGEKTRGASTITMQTAKNLFLWNGRSFLRKAAEFPLAVYVDLALPKKRIMEIYLNIAEWGDGVFGIEAAAQHYFGRPAAKLSPRQSALLAVTLPSPTSRNPAKPSAGLQRLASGIERRAAKAGAYSTCLE